MVKNTDMSGLMPQMKDKMAESNGSLFYTPRNGMDTCLSLKCKSLNYLAHKSYPKDLTNTIMDKNLAKHFMVKLCKKDEQDNTTNILSYAAMFQFCLDFYELAVRRREGPDDGQGNYPAEPATWMREQFELFQSDSEGWRNKKEIQNRLQHHYWRNHSLLQLGTSIQHGEDESDRKTWMDVINVIRNCSTTQEDLKLLAEAVDMCQNKLDEVHEEFQNNIKKSHKRRRCIVM